MTRGGDDMNRYTDNRHRKFWRAERPQYFPSSLDRVGEEDGLAPARGIGAAVVASMMVWVGVLVAAWLMGLF